MLKGPEWDDPEFVQFEAVHPRPDVAATYEVPCRDAFQSMHIPPLSEGYDRPTSPAGKRAIQITKQEARM